MPYRTPGLELQTIIVTIRELEEGWELLWGARAAEHHATAAEALNAAKTMANILAEAGISSILRVTWDAKTRAGRMVVAALQ